MLTSHDDSFLYFFLPVVPLGLFSSSFSAGKCHVDLAFPSTDSRFSSLMQTPLVVLVCLFNEYTYCYVRNIHIRRQGPPPASGDSGEVMDVMVVAEDQRPDKTPPSRSPSSHVSTSFTTNIYQRYVKGLKLASLSTFLFCARICRQIFCSLFLPFFLRWPLDGWMLKYRRRYIDLSRLTESEFRTIYTCNDWEDIFWSPLVPLCTFGLLPFYVPLLFWFSKAFEAIWPHDVVNGRIPRILSLLYTNVCLEFEAIEIVRRGELLLQNNSLDIVNCSVNNLGLYFALLNGCLPQTRSDAKRHVF